MRFLTPSGLDATGFERGDTVTVEVVDGSVVQDSVQVSIFNLTWPDTAVVWSDIVADSSFHGSLVPSWGTVETAAFDVFPGDTVWCRYVGPTGTASDTARMMTHTASIELGAAGGAPGGDVGVLDTLAVVVRDDDLWLEDSIAVDLTTSVDHDSLWLHGQGDVGEFRGVVGLLWGSGGDDAVLEVKGADRIDVCLSDPQDTTGAPRLVCDSVSVTTWNARVFWEDSLGNIVADYAPAMTDTVRIRVEDRDVAGAPSLTGEIVNLSDPAETEHVILMPGTAPDSMFRAALPIQQSSASPENGVVEATSGDTLVFRYSEEADSAGSSAISEARVRYGGTAVAGEQSGIWTAADAPFLMYGDVQVPSGQTLILEAGTIVRVLPNQDASGSGLHPDKVELVVRGELSVEGTQSDSVLLEPSSPSPEVGQWGGIRAEQGAAISVRHATITGAAVGIAGLSADVDLRDSRLCANGLESARSCLRERPPVPHRSAMALPGSLDVDTACALYLEGCESATIQNCTLGSTEGYGAFCVESSPAVVDCALQSNTLDGMVLYRCDGSVDRCRVERNGQDGIYLLESAARVTGTVVCFNQWAGIDAASGADTLVSNALVSNAAHGILLYLEEGPLIQCNSALGNGVGAACRGELAPAAFTSNSFCNNAEAGVRIDYGASPRVSLGNLYSNGTYDLEMGSSAWADVSADSNWWGDVTTAMMETGSDSIAAIWDWWDDPSLGEVHFAPWLADPSESAPHEPDSSSIAELVLSTGPEDTVRLAVTADTANLSEDLFDFCSVEMWSSQDSVGIIVALPERDPTTQVVTSGSGWFGGWVVVGTDPSSDAVDRLYVLPGGVIHGRVVANRDVADSLVWLSADDPQSVFPVAARIAFYPNPCSGSGTVVLNRISPGRCELGLYDLLGRRVGRLRVTAGPDGRACVPWTAPRHLRSGVYVWQSHRRGTRCRFLLCR